MTSNIWVNSFLPGKNDSTSRTSKIKTYISLPQSKAMHLNGWYFHFTIAKSLKVTVSLLVFILLRACRLQRSVICFVYVFQSSHHHPWGELSFCLCNPVSVLLHFHNLLAQVRGISKIQKFSVISCHRIFPAGRSVICQIKILPIHSKLHFQQVTVNLADWWTKFFYVCRQYIKQDIACFQLSTTQLISSAEWGLGHCDSCDEIELLRTSSK